MNLLGNEGIRGSAPRHGSQREVLHLPKPPKHIPFSPEKPTVISITRLVITSVHHNYSEDTSQDGNNTDNTPENAKQL